MRHSRQLALIGDDGQRALGAARVGIAGLGGLGSNALTHLACAGVRSFVLVDLQHPEESNLNRQFIHCLAEEGTGKALSAASWARRLSPGSEALALEADVSAPEAREALRGCDILLDCLDNRPSRLLLNSLALRQGIPLVHAAVQGAHGQVTVVDGGGPCLRCLLPEAAERDESAISPAAGVLGSLQACEAVKVITGRGEPLRGRLLSLDLSRHSYRLLEVSRDPGCPDCR